ncbi:RNA-binding protein 2-like [Carica papaya]|uniref:RNA-binding protein 2-like n=1 Tax=Carica papaya TaxID=3649 RepID=UPI000B8C9660|nr:RNA-binding protein 2-like [Carica papaya]XP_021907785.1 RNA-binding protein 2-like [Carica papaya]
MIRPRFPGHLSPEAPSFASTHAFGSNGLQDLSSEFLTRDRNSLRYGAYGSDDFTNIGVLPELRPGGVSAGTSFTRYSAPPEDPSFIGQRPDIGSLTRQGTTSGISEAATEKPSSTRNVDDISVRAGESNILFVDGLPTDCTRREVGHLFRPFIGYKDIRVIHKEARHSGDKARVLCFVEFVDANCALTAMEALQGYKFDDKKADSRVLKIQFVHFPFQLPRDEDEQPSKSRSS